MLLPYYFGTPKIYKVTTSLWYTINKNFIRVVFLFLLFLKNNTGKTRV
jgi:hypothetical protein